MTEGTTHEVTDGAKSSTIESALAKLKAQDPQEVQPDPGKKPDGYWVELAGRQRETIAAGPQFIL